MAKSQALDIQQDKPGKARACRSNVAGTVTELAESSVNLVVRVWTKSAGYSGVKFDATERIKRRCDTEDIGIPSAARRTHCQRHGRMKHFPPGLRLDSSGVSRGCQWRGIHR